MTDVVATEPASRVLRWAWILCSISMLLRAPIRLHVVFLWSGTLHPMPAYGMAMNPASPTDSGHNTVGTH